MRALDDDGRLNETKTHREEARHTMRVNVHVGDCVCVFVCVHTWS